MNYTRRCLKEANYTGSSKKFGGIWNSYNLKSTRRIYTFVVLKCSENFNVLHLPMYISICAPFVALETSKLNSISCHVFWIMPRVTVSMSDVILSLQVLDIPYLLSTHSVLNVPPQENIKWREIWASRFPGYCSTPSNPGIKESGHLEAQISFHLIFSCGGTLRTLCMLRR